MSTKTRLMLIMSFPALKKIVDNVMQSESSSSLPSCLEHYDEKVRECFFGDEMSVIVATDRISAFDRHLG